MTKDCCIVNVGFGSWYHAGVERLRKSLELVGWDGGTIIEETCPPESPPQSERRCAFKLHMMKKALDRGYRYVLWNDAAGWYVRHPKPIFDEMARRGVYLVRGGWSSGHWATDRSLELMGVDREESFRIFHVMGGYWGIDAQNQKAQTFFDQLWEDAHAKASPYEGPRWAKDGFCSKDSRVKGHRADQLVMSVRAYQQGIEPIWNHRSHMITTRDLGEVREWKRKVLVSAGGVLGNELEGVPYPS